MIEIKQILFFCVLLFCLLTGSTVSANNDFVLLIRACSYIPYYDRNTTDINDLMVSVLSNYSAFTVFSDKAPVADVSDVLKMCDSNYIKDVMHNVFRLSAPTPAPDKLQDLGFCYNNGFYYFISDDKDYSNADIIKINRKITLDDGSIYIFFTDTHNENSSSEITQNSAVKLKKDADGYYVTAIDMDVSYTTLNKELILQKNPSVVSDLIKKYSPLAVAFITLSLAVFVFYKVVLL